MKHSLNILLFLIIQISLYSQTYELTYEIIEVKKYEFPENFDERHKRIMNSYLKDINDYAKNFKLNILAKNNQYFYKIDDRLPIESMSQEYKQVTTLSKIGLSQNLFFDSSSVYYYNNTDKFITKSDLDLLEWNITGNKKRIKNYNCYEICPEIITDYNLGYNSVGLKAWFTNDINIKGGPTPYANVPGLIVSLENQFVKYELTNIKETQKEFPKISDFTSGYKVYSFENAEKYHRKVGKMIESNYKN